MATQKKVIIIAGPTAVGKTTAAIEVARHFNTEIISADSRQCYKELNIGVARPGAEELTQVKHHFIASHSIHDKIDAAVFEQYALQKTGEIFQKNDVAVMVGGTGLYIKAFCEGIDEIPEVSEEIQSQVRSTYKEKGLDWLQAEVKKKDPEFFAVAEIHNPQRLMRALEVNLATNKSILEFRRGKKVERPFSIEKIALELPREELKQRINNRVDQMMEMGLLEEVKSLLPCKHLNALQTVGYKELFSHLAGDISLQEAVEQIKTNTRQYAKRQMTWFKKYKEYQWFPPTHVKFRWGIG
jgi:tRNA dimethylallyltransferase